MHFFSYKKGRREKMKMEMRYRSARSSLVADDELKSSTIANAAETNPTGKSENATRTKIPLQRESSKSGWRLSEEEIGTSSSSE